VKMEMEIAFSQENESVVAYSAAQMQAALRSTNVAANPSDALVNRCKNESVLQVVEAVEEGVMLMDALQVWRCARSTRWIRRRWRGTSRRS
jgi:hypothetical protein